MRQAIIMWLLNKTIETLNMAAVQVLLSIPSAIENTRLVVGLDVLKEKRSG